MKHIKSLLGYLANTGLVFRADPPKVIDVESRKWGEVSGGLALSIAPMQAAEPGQRHVLSVVLRNIESAPKEMKIPGWLHFFEIQITSETGAKIEPNTYGQEALKSGGQKTRIDVRLGPEEPIEIELPIGALYDLGAPGKYKIRLSCRVPGEAPVILRSNECVIEIPPHRAPA